MRPAFTVALGAFVALSLPILPAPVLAQQPAQAKRPPVLAAGDAAPTPWKRYSAWPARDTSDFNTLANPPSLMSLYLQLDARNRASGGADVWLQLPGVPPARREARESELTRTGE